MLEKGIVLELKEQYAIVLKPGGELLRIKRKDGLKVGDRIYILPEDHYAEPPAPPVIPFPTRNRKPSPGQRERRLRQLAGLAAVIVLVVTLALYPAVQPVYAVASFDGDRDLQLELDHSSRIVNGYSYGEPLPQEELQKLKGQKLADVGEDLTDILGSGPVLIGYASHKEDDRGDAQTEQLLREMFGSHVILYLSGNGEDIELAESAKTSLGLHLAGEIVDEDTMEVLDEFLEAYVEYQLESGEDDEDEEDDEDLFSHLDHMDFEALLQEVQRNPDYAGSDEVLEILADKMEELHEDHKEENWDRDEDDDDLDDDDEDNDEDPDDEEDEDD